MKAQTLGFIYNKDKSKVLLILKEKPDWQKGKLNGIGGKNEENESSIACMARETAEETALVIPESAWVKYAEILVESASDIDVFATVYEGDESDAKSPEGPEVSWYPTHSLPLHILSNLSWLIPAGIDFLQEDQLTLIHAKYNLRS